MPHTPGPHFAVNYAGFVVMQPTPHYHSNADLLNQETCDSAEDNGKLYAAAPQLYAAAKMFIRHYEGNSTWAEVYKFFKDTINNVENG